MTGNISVSEDTGRKWIQQQNYIVMIVILRRAAAAQQLYIVDYEMFKDEINLQMAAPSTVERMTSTSLPSSAGGVSATVTSTWPALSLMLYTVCVNPMEAAVGDLSTKDV